jgi:hypothetical protein
MAKKKKERAFWCWAPGRLIACGLGYLWFLVITFIEDLLPDWVSEWVFIVAIGIGWFIIWGMLKHLQELEYMKQNNIRVTPNDPNDPDKGETVWRFKGDEDYDWVEDFKKQQDDQSSASTGESFQKNEGGSTEDSR